MRHDWVGVSFLVLGHHDGRLIHAPGLWSFCRVVGEERTLLYVDHADRISEVAGVGHPCWEDALSLGMNELHVCLKARTRIDRLQLRQRIIQREEPLLNALERADLSGSGIGASLPRRLRA